MGDNHRHKGASHSTRTKILNTWAAPNSGEDQRRHHRPTPGASGHLEDTHVMIPGGGGDARTVS